MIDRFSATPDNRMLVVDWSDGRTSELAATMLRREAKDAHSQRERIDNGKIHVAEGITITDIVQVGRVGVNVHFSDGHDRAIYPFVYLRELSEMHGN